AFSPARVAPGNPTFNTRNVPKVVGGVGPESTAIAAALYRTAIETIVEASSPQAAEMVKLLENTFRMVNIGLVNEIALMCDRLGLDVWEVVDAAKTKPFGFMPFYPGPGLGGHDLAALPIDAATLAGVDCVAILADHSAFDYDALVAAAPLIVDTRNAIKPPHPHVFKLGAPRMLRAETWQPATSDQAA